MITRMKTTLMQADGTLHCAHTDSDREPGLSLEATEQITVVDIEEGPAPELADAHMIAAHLDLMAQERAELQALAESNLIGNYLDELASTNSEGVEGSLLDGTAAPEAGPE